MSRVETTTQSRGAGIKPERRLATQHAAVAALAEAVTLADAVPRLLEAIGAGLGWDFAGLWLPDANGGGEGLRCADTWSSREIDASAFDVRSRELQFGPGSGLPGRVWESGAPVWVTDVTVDDNFLRGPEAKRAGLHTAFAFPVVRGEEVVGVLEFLTRDKRTADEGVLSDFAVFGFQIGQFIGREIAERSLRESRDQLEAILRSVPAGIMVIDRGERIVFANAAAAGYAGSPDVSQLVGRHAGEALREWEVVDEQGEPLPGGELPGLRALRGNPGPAVVLRRRREEGEDRWLLARATPVDNGQGGFVAVSVFEEISEIKSGEEELRASEGQHRSISHTLQQGLAPPSAPEVPGMEVAVRFRAMGEASEIGGDFYDLFPTGERRWGLLIGDVSGKGVDAATTAALARNTVRATAQHDDSPVYVLSMLNQAVRRQLTPSRFCTAVYATIEVGELWVRVEVACAGHPSPLLLRSHGGVEEVGGRGPLLAGFEDAAYRSEPVHLAAGDSLILYTDGVVEAGERRGDDGARLALSGLGAVLGACVGAGAEEIAQSIQEAVVEAEGDEGPRDDAAVLVLRQPTER